MSLIHTIDLHFLDRPRAIAAYAIPDDAGVTLVECGPFSTHERLLAGLRDLGFSPEDVHSVLLTHIHFDHAGAAWWWAQRGATIYVHPRGRAHLIEPSRLYGSAARIYGQDNMERLWGRMESIAEERVIAIQDRGVLTLGGQEWTAHHTPGHASHHIAWQLTDCAFTGDVGGVVIDQGPPVPPCPPPDIDVEAWEESIERLRSLDLTTLYPTHFGQTPATAGHFTDLLRRLNAYVRYVREREGGARAQVQSEEFSAMVTAELRAAGCQGATVEAYLAANPPDMSVAGIRRYLVKREEARGK